MRSKNMRLLTMLVIPLSLCSARLQVFLFMTATLFTTSQAPLVLFALYLVSFSTIFITAILFKNQYKNNEPFILELPPYRFPTLRQIWLRGWQEVKYFLNRASKFITIGVILVWALTHLPMGLAPASKATFAGQIGDWFSTVLTSNRFNFWFCCKRNCDRSASSYLWVARRCVNAFNGSKTWLGTRYELYAVHAHLHPLFVDDYYTKEWSKELALCMDIYFMVISPGMGGQLHILPISSFTRLLRKQEATHRYTSK